MLVAFLFVTLGTLILAIVGLAFAEPSRAWVRTLRTGIFLASLGLGIGPAVVIGNAVSRSRSR
jgi:hypothetical protein